jgi:hypothetical protein
MGEQPGLSQFDRAVLNALYGISAAKKAPRCQHVKVNGTRCGSPAMRQRKLCYYHERQRVEPKHSKDLEIPLLEDATSVQLAITRVCQSIANRAIDAKTAGLLLYGLQTAASNVRSVNEESTDTDEVVLDRNLSVAEHFFEPTYYINPDPKDDEDEDDEDEDDKDEDEED